MLLPGALKLRLEADYNSKEAMTSKTIDLVLVLTPPLTWELWDLEPATEPLKASPVSKLTSLPLFKVIPCAYSQSGLNQDPTNQAEK